MRRIVLRTCVSMSFFEKRSNHLANSLCAIKMAYLNRLLERNEGDEFANLAIRLYAEYDPKKLLPFLRKKQSYDITKALEICEGKQYIKEVHITFTFYLEVLADPFHFTWVGCFFLC